MANYRLYCLGHPLLEMDGKQVKLEMRKALALVVYLRMADHAYSRESLSTLFWPEYDQYHAQANLRRVLSSLNKCLQSDLLEANREKIGLKDRSKVWLDVECFQALLSTTKNHVHANNQVCSNCMSLLEEAARLYRGDFLEGFNLGDCPEFDEWQFLQRESLRNEFAWALQKGAEGSEAHSDLEQAIAYTRRWVALDRLNQPAQRLLIYLYGQAGQRSAGVRQYNEFVRLLQEELGQEPESEITTLYHRIRDGTAIPNQDQVMEVSKESARFTTPLLKSKLYIPSSRVQKVNRQRIINELNRIEQYSLAVLSAPAGFGKTTTLVEWAAQSSLPVGWYSLDSGDNEVVQFLSYFIAALASIQGEIGIQAQSLLQDPQSAPIQLVLTHLIHELGGLQTPSVLVLDDYQFITAKVIHDAVSFFLEYLPPNLHLIIATRADPPLGLARYRLQKQLLEIRVQDLRFNPEEALEFLTKSMALPLTLNDVTLLDRRIEGWAVGYQMAAIAMQSRRSLADRAEISHFIQTFSGSHRYVLDYLTEEVLSRQPKIIHEFLLKTSILERLSSPVCDAVLGKWEQGAELQLSSSAPGDISPARSSFGSSQQILEYLERSNLFIASLDDERCWYRYHHLFADLLQARLVQFIGEQGVRDLHFRASKWYEKNHLVDEAIKHALAAGDYNQAANLIEDVAEKTWLRGEYEKLEGWIKTLPTEIVRSRPWLCVWCAWSFSQTGPMVDAGLWADAAEQALNEQILDQPSNQSTNFEAIRDDIDAIRIIKFSLEEDYDKTIELALPVLEHKITRDRVSSQITRCHVLHGLSTAYLVTGELSRAEQICQETATVAKGIGFFLRYIHAMNKQALIRRATGRLHQSYQDLQETLAFMHQQGRQNYFPLSDVYDRLSDLYYEWNRFEDAQKMIAEGFRVNEVTEVPYLLVDSLNALAHLQIAQGDLDGAGANLQKSADLIQKYTCWPPLIWEYESYSVKLWLARGDLGTASRWVQEHHVTNPEAAGFAQEAFEIACARVFIAQGSIKDAMGVLAQLGRCAESAGRNGRLIEIQVLGAMAQKAAGDEEKARLALEQALLLAEPEGYVRVFLDEGEAMKLLLEDCQLQLSNRKNNDDQDVRISKYIDQLLTAF